MAFSMQTSPVTTHTAELYAAAAIFLTQIGALIAAHLKGKRGDRTTEGRLTAVANDLRTAINVRCDTLTTDLSALATGLRTDISTLSAHVIGPDGQNGLRGDVRKLRTDVDELQTPRRRRRA